MTEKYSDFNEKMNEYYKLKNTYEKEKMKQVAQILKMDASIAKKRRTYNQLKPQCINCKRPVGTVFTCYYDHDNANTGKILRATCGDVVTPCNLRILLDTGVVELYVNDIKYIEEELKEVKNNIIVTKNRLLFNYIKEEEAIEEFAKYKKEINDYSDLLANYLQEYYNIIENPDKKKDLQKKQNEYYEIIKQIKESMDNFDAKSDETFVEDAVELFVKRLEPVMEEILKLKYSQMYVDYNDSNNTYSLIEKPFTISDTEFYHREPKVMEFTINAKTDKTKNTNANTDKTKKTNVNTNKTRKTDTSVSIDSGSDESKNTSPNGSIDWGSDESKNVGIRIEGCESNGKNPEPCKTKRDYYDQARLFHPDKNPGCKEDAEAKFKKLSITLGCSNFPTKK